MREQIKKAVEEVLNDYEIEFNIAYDEKLK
jgi:hypothetical protein